MTRAISTSRSRVSATVGRLLPLALLAAVSLSGCEAEAPEYTEVRRIDEELTIDDLRAFARIVSQLPEQRLPPWPEMFLPPPQWKASRTLTIGELLKEDQAALDERWSVDSLAARLAQNRLLQRILIREQITPEQFVGLTLSVGMSLCAGTVRETQDLDSLVSRGEAVLSDLRQDQRTFSSLIEDDRFHVLRSAIWLSRVHRAKLLGLVPEENIRLVERYRDRILPMFPEEFSLNPLDPIADVLAEKGLPFEELPESGFDDHIVWNRDDAIVGHDRFPETVASPQLEISPPQTLEQPPEASRAPVVAPRPVSVDL